MSAVKSLRLDRLLANMGYGSRAEVQALIFDEQVILDGEVIDAPEQHIALRTDLPQRMTISGAPVDLPPGHLVLMLNKPLGVTCSHKDAGPLVYSLLPARWRQRDPAISTVGRLDKDTSGLLLMTDDGQLLHKIISPKHKVAKRYRVTLDRPLAGNETEIFAAGTLMLESEKDPLAPAMLEVLGEREALLTITEGRYHQVRRMFAAVGNHVNELHRDRVGGLELPMDLAPGAFRVLTAVEIGQIFA